MISFINNNLTIGVIGSLIATLIYEFIKNIKSNKEYNRRVEKVKFEFLVFVRKMLVQEDAFEAKLLYKFLFSLADENNIKFNDIKNIEPINNSIIKEILESPFVSVIEKNKLAKKVVDFQSDYDKQIKFEDHEKATMSHDEYKINMYRYRRILALIIFYFTNFVIIQIFLWFKQGKVVLDSGIIFNMNSSEKTSILVVVVWIIGLTVIFAKDKQISRKRLAENKKNST
ncbi:hypothetical protein [Lysinibacillus sp. K60]|uniref:hypothetical protein n=1 Tax=Lysinibacillus sp. K60 TaxID=2720027 RepID=UPI001C8C9F90|nr:hypothetical protein [Lysinibacillus sp. K60]MBX8942558.1 hypothetical protein [Lysinibacillus sp. K60]